MRFDEFLITILEPHKDEIFRFIIDNLIEEVLDSLVEMSELEVDKKEVFEKIKEQILQL